MANRRTRRKQDTSPSLNSASNPSGRLIDSPVKNRKKSKSNKKTPNSKVVPPRARRKAVAPKASATQASHQGSQRPKAPKTPGQITGLHEAVAVILAASGILTLLSIATYHPLDASLNASRSSQVENWIGPAGAYWADFLLQTIGIGAYALGVGMLLASWRALVGRNIRPGWREGIGSLLLMVSVGTFSHILLVEQAHNYPAGGFLGALLGTLLLEQFAVIGAYIIAGALVLATLAFTANGVLVGMGHRGLGTLRELYEEAHDGIIAWREKRRQLAVRRAEMGEIEENPESMWSVYDDDAYDDEASLITPVESEVLPPPIPSIEDQRRVREEKLEQAIARGRLAADQQAEAELKEAKRKALRAVPEPAPVDQTVDLPKEEAFEMGPEPTLSTPTPSRGAPKVTLRAVEEPDETTGQSDEPSVVIQAAQSDGTTSQTAVDESAEIQVEPIRASKSRPKRVIGEGKDGADPEIIDARPEVDVAAIEKASKEADAAKRQKSKTFELPSTSLLDICSTDREVIDNEVLRANAQRLVETLKHYGITGQIREIRPGPVITMYEFVPAPGTKISKIAGLSDDIAMSMEALRVRIVAPIPGKGAVGIEIPNKNVETVFLKELITHKSFQKSKAKLPIALGKDTEGTPYVADLTKMPHLLVAGATGAGKSVSVNAMIMSIIFNATPDEVRLIMVDPKMLELSVYDDIPHLLLPVVTDPKKAAAALRWAVVEMERRYRLLSGLGVRNIDSYNKKVKAATDEGRSLSITTKDKLGNDQQEACDHLPYIVIIVDELADLMMVASREVESSIMRLAQMARAAGLHLILATQRPSVDVLTGVIKANFPTRIAFQVASKHDSRTILDAVGAEHLLGRGDMLYLSPGAGGVSRVHGSFVSDDEIERSVNFVKQQGEPQYDESILAAALEPEEAPESDEPIDELYDQAVAIVLDSRQASISMIQRRLRIGYNRAARLVETMEREGVVGAADGSKPREVLVPNPTT